MNFFSGFGGFPFEEQLGRRTSQEARTKAVKKALDVTLEQCYRGEVIKVPHERVRCC